MNEIGKNEGLKSVKHSPFLFLKKVGIYDDRERKMATLSFIKKEKTLKLLVLWIIVRYSHGIFIPLHQIIINYSDMANLNRIKLVLVEKNKTGKWLADELGKTPCTVSKWCQNSIQPDLQTLDKISKLLDVNIKDLLVDNKE